jgi:hypothetical protein
MRHEIIKLNSEQEYIDILKFLKELGETVYGHLQYTNTWSIMKFNQTEWELASKERLKEPFNLISYSDFISKYSKKEETIDYKHTVYIKGDLTRGKEVIQKLIDLGGKNVFTHNGISSNTFYYIKKTDNSISKLSFKSLPPCCTTELFLDEPINKIEVFPGIYVGDIVVSLGERQISRKTGDIFKVLVESKKGYLNYKRDFTNSNSHEWRLATPEEKEAFEKGITNINDIKKEPEEDFSKFIGQWVTYHKWSKKSVCKIRYIKKRKEDSYHVFFNKGYVDFEASLHVYWGIDSKDLKILSKEELKDYLPKDVYMKEFPETVKSTSLQDYLNSIPDTFTGYLEGFLKEIVQKIVERQVEQGNEPDYKVFEKEDSASKKSKGFDWMESKEGYDFWKEVILYKHFNLFYEKYPKTETKVTTTNIYNVEGDIYGILTSDGNITTIDTKDYIIPIVKHSHISTNSRYVIDDGRYVKEHFIKDHELNESYQKNSLENKTTTFEHLPFIQVKPLEIF